MPRIRLEIPDALPFRTTIPVRITDINYGGHAGNDTILSLIHEARMQYLRQAGYSEMNIEGIGLIMSDVAIEFKSELFYGDLVIASVGAGELTRVGFELVYKLEKEAQGKLQTVALAKTGMVCFDYSRKKICALPEPARQKLV